MDDKGNVFYCDQKKDMINSGGENVSSQEVEGVISKHPKVMQAAVLGLPDPKWIEAATAFIVARPGETPTARTIWRAIKCPSALSSRQPCRPVPPEKS